MSPATTAARLQTRRGRFEVIVVEPTALAFKNGKTPWRDDILVVAQVYKDHKKGLKASTGELKEVFGSTDPYQVAKRILAEGDLLLTLETIKKLTEEKRKQIAGFITRISLDPATGMPIPQLRIEQAMSQASVSIDAFRDVEEQVKVVIEALRPFLPLKIKEALMDVQFAPKVSLAGLKTVESIGELRKRADGKDGSVTLTLAVPEALRTRAAERLSKKFGENVKISFK